MPVLVSCQSLTKSYGLRPLFSNLSLGIDEGERLGVIGPNGSGKSTLLRLLAGLDQPDEGAVTTRRGLRLRYVPQEDTFPEGETIRSILRSAATPHQGGEDAANVAAETMIANAGFADADQTAETLSGGWRKRLAVTREIIAEPDVLLLDEPTNHLDLEGVLWLEEALKNAPFTFAMITHDRAFLENTVRRIFELNPAYAGGFFSVDGAYADYIERRAEYMSAQEQREDTLNTQAKREIAWLRRGAQARRTKAQSRIADAHELLGELSTVRDRNAQGVTAGIAFAGSGRKTRNLLVATDLTKAYDGRVLFSDLTLTLSPGRRLGLIGPNGSGKSTLLRILMGEQEPDTGTVRPADGLQIVYFDQNRAALDKSLSLRDALSPNGETVNYRGQTMHVSGWAKRFLFAADQLQRPLSTLSGGEQARVRIAQLMLMPADVLILDEPTNDLDIPTLQVIEDSLSSFPGSLVLVSHDRFLLDTVSTEILALDGRGHAGFFADYDQWKAVQADTIRSPAPPKANSRHDTPRAPQTGGRMSAAERREWKQIEEKIAAAEEEVRLLKERMEDPSVVTDSARLQEAWAALPAAEEKVLALYARWEELEAMAG